METIETTDVIQESKNKNWVIGQISVNSIDLPLYCFRTILISDTEMYLGRDCNNKKQQVNFL